jgi:hypothetical protein
MYNYIRFDAVKRIKDGTLGAEAYTLCMNARYFYRA